jgi:cytochrome c556
MGWRTVGALAIALGVGAAVGAPPDKPRPKDTEPALTPPDYLNELARHLLKERMTRHRRDMSRLVQAVLVLDRAAARELAQSLANEPRITRPTPGSTDELNAALPERFFVRQDELRERAKALAAAAQHGSDDELALRFGDLVRTCVGCHSAYLERSPSTQNLQP